MLALFGLELMMGISLMWCLMPRAQVTSGFFRIQMLLMLGLAAVTFLSAGLLNSDAAQVAQVIRVSTGIIGVTAYAGSIAWTLDRRNMGTGCVFLIASSAAIAVAFTAWHHGTPEWLSVGSAWATAASLGGAVTGMLLGHWYLTAPTMSIQPLSRLTWWFAAALETRLVVSTICYLFSRAELHGSLPWTWFALRWLAGIVAPLVLCGMTLRILRYRNTQAATGVLFASVIVTFIGEMSATLLLGELRRPF